MDVEQLGRLRDILEAARLIARYVSDTTEAAFRADRQKQDAVIRRIEIIGEAAAHLSEATRQAVTELPFRKMRGMRNIVAHDYANVDLNSCGRSRPSTFPKCAPRSKNSSPRKSNLRHPLLEPEIGIKPQNWSTKQEPILGPADLPKVF